MVETEETRKGPWTEQEDVQLAFYVNLFGDRRWDFIAKVSGLKRTGKSCRLRWVNYLHPGLKRVKMTPLEERLVLELHSKWGNRWSRIARKLPGRTDNEIKNYWRTLMRKKAQDQRKKATTTTTSSPSSSSLSNSSASSSSQGGNSPTVESSVLTTETKDRSFYDTGGFEFKNQEEEKEAEKGPKFYSMDEIWKDIELSEEDAINPVYDPTMASPMWDYNYPVSLWNMTDDVNPPPPISDHQIYSFYNNNNNQENFFLV